MYNRLVCSASEIAVHEPHQKAVGVCHSYWPVAACLLAWLVDLILLWPYPHTPTVSPDPIRQHAWELLGNKVQLL